jgi:endonuclease-3
LDRLGHVKAVHRRLEEVFGRPRKETAGDPLDGLILTMLSQNTNDRNRDRAFARLKERFPTWEAALKAGPQALEEAIRVGGLARIKSRRIWALLDQLRHTQGRISLQHLRGLPSEEAEQRLLAIPGVGKKTARCVLLFHLGRDAFPADTHILRVTRRLGWIPEQATADRAHEILQGLIPPPCMFSLHLNLIHLGRTLCRPKASRCPSCPVQPWCQHGGGTLTFPKDEDREEIL